MDNAQKFLEKSLLIHNHKYDYSKVEYINNKSKVCIICPVHGEFWQTPHNHLSGSGCIKCGREKSAIKRRNDSNEIINKFNLKHNFKFDYSKMIYKGLNKKICIICPEHGEFWQTPYSHLINDGCPKCSRKYMDGEYFKEKSYEKHQNKYDYSKVVFKGVHEKVCIICPEHGEFWQTPHHHLDGFGCKKCSNNFLNKEMFIEKSNKIHNYKYDYTNVEYVNNRTKVCIICPEHGEFWQAPNSHLNGRGCKKCNDSHLEREMEMFLTEVNIKYVSQYRDIKIFNKQSLDFYLPEYNIAIECQGEQHFISNFFKSKGEENAIKQLEYIQQLDIKKAEICKENNIKLVYFLNKKFNNFLKNNEIFINDKRDLLNIINK